MIEKESPKWWKLAAQDIAEELHTDLKGGLTALEVKKRLEEYGPNRLPEQKKVSPVKLFLSQFSSLIVWILIGAAAIAGILGEWIDAWAITVIVVLNAVLGFVQEYRAERSLAALKKLSSPKSKVLRDGASQIVDSVFLVPGDLVLLEAGDRVPADGRVVYSVQLSVQEAALTGESMPVPKIIEAMTADDLPLGDKKNMAFMGTVVVRGKGRMVVTQTGLATELGKIASLLREGSEEKTPLQIRLEGLGRRLVLFCLGIVVVVFVLGLARGIGFIDILLTALSLAVAAIPEGLPAIVTVALALGVRRMAKRNALIRRLPSVETLGCASVICTDKTGTLTQNEMTVRSVWVNEKFVDVAGAGYSPQGGFEQDGKGLDPEEHPELMMALKISVLCNNAQLGESDGAWQIIGDPTEGSLIVAAAKAGLKKEDLEAQYPLTGEIPFDSDRKRMSVARQSPQGEGKVLFVKGAPDIILERCGSILINGKKVPLGPEQKNGVLRANGTLAGQALRVLALAWRELGRDIPMDESAENDLTFAGLMAMSDPPRPEAKKSIELCRRAGIRTVMITGDHKETAVAVARELGLMERGELAIDGQELDRMSEESLNDNVRKIVVYSRVSAEHKLKIVRAWKAAGEIVAMTGDGVNDAPAIKEADIGIAMGMTGTDVTKEASDMVITDDNFASIVNAVEEGRGIYDNIIKFVNYLLSSNIAELLVIFMGMLLGFTDRAGNAFVSLSAVQLLWMNLVTDGFPAIALGLDPLAPGAMERAPRKVSEPILSSRFAFQLCLVSLTIAAAALTACHFGLRQGVPMAQTMTLTALVVMQLVRVQVIRSRYHIGLFSNPWLAFALAGSLALQLCVIYIPPLQNVFGTVSLGKTEWGLILTVTFLVWCLTSGMNRLFKNPSENSFKNY